MVKFKVLFGTPIGDDYWKEDVLLEGETDMTNEQIITFGKNKFGKTHNRFRVMIDDGKFPDFKKVVR